MTKNFALMCIARSIISRQRAVILPSNLLVNNSPGRDTGFLRCWKILDSLVCEQPLTFLQHRKSENLPFPHLHYLFQSFFSCAFYLFHCPFHSSSPEDINCLLDILPEPCYWLQVSTVSIIFSTQLSG